MAATRKTNTQQKSPVFENAVVEEKNNIPKSKKIDFDEKITVRNIAPWAVGWNKVESLGEININPYGSVRISRAEYIAGFENGNKLLCGIENGKHATVVTDDKATKDYLEVDDFVITKKTVENIFAVEGIADFEDLIIKTFITRAEKLLLIKYIKECGINDYNRVRFCENYCGAR